MEFSNLIPIVAILAGAVAVVFVLRYFMHRRVPPPVVTAPVAPAAPRPAQAPLTMVEEEYLDSSHIITRPADRREPPR